MPDRLLLEISQRAKATVCEEYVIGKTHLKTQCCKERILFGWRKRITQPLPGVLIVGRYLIALHNRERHLPVYPASEDFSAEDEIGTGIENAEQIPHFTDFRLNRSCRAKHQVAGAGANPNHEIEKVIRLFLTLSQPATSACFVCLVEYYRSVLPLQEELAFIGAMNNQPGRNDGDVKMGSERYLPRRGS